MPERNAAPQPSRRLLLKAGALSVGVGLLGAGGAIASAPAPGGGADGTGAGADGAPPPPGAPQSRTLNQAAAAVPADPTSYNGWPVGSPGSMLGVQNYTVPGTNVVLPIRAGEVATVLMYVATRFNNEVEALVRGQCWGYDYRANVNNPNVWSNHASATAIDLNSLKHANGATGTFTASQTAAVRRILDVCGDVVYWGQDYRGVVDGMHFEIDVPPGSSSLASLVGRINPTNLNANAQGVDAYIDGGGVYRVFGRSPAGGLTELVYPPGAGGWDRVDSSNGGYLLATPAVSYRNGRVDVFVIGGDAAAWTQNRNDGGRWSGWQRMGGANLAGGMAAVKGGDGLSHVFCVAKNGVFVQFYGSYENGWSLQDVSNGVRLQGAPAAVYQNGRYDVFGIGLDGTILQQTYFNGRPAWEPWRRIGASAMIGGLRAVRNSNGAFRVIGIDTGWRLQQFTSSDGSNWSARDVSNGGIVSGAPAITQAPGRTDVFAVGLDKQVWQQTLSAAGQWYSWHAIGGTIA